MAPTLGGVTGLDQDRIRVRRWEGRGVNLGTVLERLVAQQAELAGHDVDDDDHPHPRNCALNLVVGLDDRHRATACDKLVGSLAATHPLRAILVHLHGGRGPDGIDAEITSEAHQLVQGFPVQREQILLHVRGEAAHHLASLVEPLLVPDVPTYLWWSGREHLDEGTIRDAMLFSDILVVDSLRFEHPVGALLEVARLVASADEPPIGVADFRWGRMRPWRDAISQFFAPAARLPLLRELREVDVTAAGTGPGGQVGAALLTGWLTRALGWRLSDVRMAGDDGIDASAAAEGPDTHRVRLRLRSVANDRLAHGELLTVRLAGRARGKPFALLIERDPGGADHAHVTIDLGGAAPLGQRLTLPRAGDPDLLVHALWAGRREQVFLGALRGATPVLEALAS